MPSTIRPTADARSRTGRRPREHPVLGGRRGRASERDRREPRLIEESRSLRVDLTAKQRAGVLKCPVDPRIGLISDIPRVRFQRSVCQPERPLPCRRSR
jgi:hypothetical protein